MIRMKVIGACAAIALVLTPTLGQAAGWGHHYGRGHGYGHYGAHNLPVSTWFLALGAWGFCVTGSLMLRSAMGPMSREDAHEALGNCIIPFVGGMILRSMVQPMPQPAAPPPVRRAKVKKS
jgi:hypothetical protein